ncbi:hypothetical protein B0H14DRAFT_2585300 [Mycena olivaceomarginata]|nr:hypothetical protein B0H14DRAFT_2585300 [Mycena olivaceomarginata]
MQRNTHGQVEDTIVWDRFCAKAEAEYQTAMKDYLRKLTDYEEKKKIFERGAEKGNPPKPPKKPFRRMHKDEPRNFLQFSTALKNLVGSSITHNGLERAKGLLRDYLLKFSECIFLIKLKIMGREGHGFWSTRRVCGSGWPGTGGGLWSGATRGNPYPTRGPVGYNGPRKQAPTHIFAMYMDILSEHQLLLEVLHLEFICAS